MHLPGRLCSRVSMLMLLLSARMICFLTLLGLERFARQLPFMRWSHLEELVGLAHVLGSFDLGNVPVPLSKVSKLVLYPVGRMEQSSVSTTFPDQKMVKRGRRSTTELKSFERRHPARLIRDQYDRASSRVGIARAKDEPRQDARESVAIWASRSGV